MRILAIESATFGGSVALLEDQQLLVERQLDSQRRTAQTLSPAMRDLLAELDWKPRDIQLVAVTQGPGSFTGLRIGITAAKLFAYATGAEILGVNTLEVLAQQVPPSGHTLWAVMLAERGELFAAAFQGDQGRWQERIATRIVRAEPWIQQLTAPCLVTGPALENFPLPLPDSVEQTPREMWTPRAGNVGQVAWTRFQNGERETALNLQPVYFRDSAAEEKAKQRR